jgi:hypothetical protein
MMELFLDGGLMKRWIWLSVLVVGIHTVLFCTIVFLGVLLPLPPDILLRVTVIELSLAMACLVLVLDKGYPQLEPFLLRVVKRLDPGPEYQGWRTWNPFQTSTMREICRHMTAAERTEVARRGLLLGRHLAVSSLLYLPALLAALTIESPLLLPLPALAAALVGAFAACRIVPLVAGWKGWLCSTEWSRAQGLTPEQFRITGVGGTILAWLLLIMVLAILVLFVVLALDEPLGELLDPVRTWGFALVSIGGGFGAVVTLMLLRRKVGAEGRSP